MYYVMFMLLMSDGDDEQLSIICRSTKKKLTSQDSDLAFEIRDGCWARTRDALQIENDVPCKSRVGGVNDVNSEYIHRIDRYAMSFKCKCQMHIISILYLNKTL
jgi:hypothetical protein